MAVVCEAECVGAAIRFAHGVAADKCAVTKTGQVFFLLCLRAVVDERSDRCPEMRVNGKEQPVILAGVPETLEGRHGGEWIHAEPAVFGGDGQALDAEATALFPSVVVEDAVTVVFDYVVAQLLAGEASDRVQ